MKRYYVLFITLIVAVIAILVFRPLFTSASEPIQPQYPTDNVIASEPYIAPSPTPPPPTSDPPAELPSPIPTLPDPLTTPDLSSPSDAQNTRSLIATRAAELAVASMPGAYSWDEYRTCSSFVSAYLRQLSFPVTDIRGGNPNGFPWTSVMDQTAWLRANYPDFVHDAALIDFLEGKLWDRIQPGAVIFLQTPLNHNGYNTYSHTAVLVGYRDGQPVFAELASGMSNASADRTFSQLTINYLNNNGGWNTDPHPGAASSGLLVTWFDPFAVIHQSPMWLKPGIVTPNSDQISDFFDAIITVNIFDGTTAIFQKPSPYSNFEQISLEGRDSFFAVTGRLLPANKKITEAFINTRSDGIYDGDFGVYYSYYGVYQHSWTPQMVARIDGIEYLSGFGGLDGSTDTSLPTPLVYDKRGDLVDYQNRSSFTIHKIPDVTNQDILLRLDLLLPANDPQSSSYGPLPYPTGALSSGCVNYDPNTWKLIRSYILTQMSEGKKVGLILSYPGFDQDLLPTFDLNRSPFTGSEFNKWCYGNAECDYYDRRNYRQTYLESISQP